MQCTWQYWASRRGLSNPLFDGTHRRDAQATYLLALNDSKTVPQRQYRAIADHLRHCSALASPAMGHWGTCPPPRLPASYFGDHSLYRLRRVMRTVFCPVERFLAIGSADCHWIVALLCSCYRWERVVRYCSDFCAIFGPLLSFFCPQFSSGSNYSSQNAGTIANKFQLHTYFRFQ